ncbi:hypothetical protein [Amycolatopsis anabasis]|uniref:hypothetical protein n=1 Tax=Amycolatopsis anabasis TaxID=1840409 RepID=UPI00131C52F0|nr:hypothetical protein [Amycolatopsis anabasis]
MTGQALPEDRTSLLALARQAGIPRAHYLTTGELRDALRHPRHDSPHEQKDHGDSPPRPTSR